MSFSHPPRRGFTLTELMVAGSLLVAMIAFVVPLTVRTGRLWQDTRQQQLALDELSNQLEHLTSLDSDQVDEALATLELSEPVKAAIPDARIEGEVLREADGAQLILTFRWDEATPSVRKRPPVTLVGWIFPGSSQNSSSDVEGGSASEAKEDAS